MFIAINKKNTLVMPAKAGKSPRHIKNTCRPPLKKGVAALAAGGFSRLRGNDSGFTLLEILIALFVFTILAMIVVSALHSITTNQAATEKRAAKLTELQFAFLILSRDIQQTVNRPITSYKGLEPAFTGAIQEITFTHGGWNNPLGQMHHSTLQRTQYTLSGGKFLRLTWPVLDYTKKTEPDARELLSDVAKLSFEFIDTKNKFFPAWPPAEQPQAVIPRAVKITLVLTDGNKITQLYAIPAETNEPSKRENDETTT